MTHPLRKRRRSNEDDAAHRAPASAGPRSDSHTTTYHIEVAIHIWSPWHGSVVGSPRSGSSHPDYVRVHAFVTLSKFVFECRVWPHVTQCDMLTSSRGLHTANGYNLDWRIFTCLHTTIQAAEAAEY